MWTASAVSVVRHGGSSIKKCKCTTPTSTPPSLFLHHCISVLCISSSSLSVLFRLFVYLYIFQKLSMNRVKIILCLLDFSMSSVPYSLYQSPFNSIFPHSFVSVHKLAPSLLHLVHWNELCVSFPRLFPNCAFSHSDCFQSHLFYFSCVTLTLSFSFPFLPHPELPQSKLLTSAQSSWLPTPDLREIGLCLLPGGISAPAAKVPLMCSGFRQNRPAPSASRNEAVILPSDIFPKSVKAQYCYLFQEIQCTNLWPDHVL